jgi:hypothetical protein
MGAVSGSGDYPDTPSLFRTTLQLARNCACDGATNRSRHLVAAFGVRLLAVSAVIALPQSLAWSRHLGTVPRRLCSKIRFEHKRSAFDWIRRRLTSRCNSFAKYEDYVGQAIRPKKPANHGRYRC